MSYLAELFEKIAADINRPISDFAPFIKILEQNWYDTEQGVRQIRDEEFDSLKIPKRIVAKIRQFTAPPEEQKQQNQLKQPSAQDWQNNDNKPRVLDLNKVLKEQVGYEDAFANFISSLQVETTNNKTKMLESTRILLKIIQNILQNPDNEKFKVIKSSSKTLSNYLLCYDSCVCILQFIGFIKTADEIIMLEPNIDHLKSCRRNLQIQIQKIQNMYDPYQASFNSSNMMPNTISHQSGDKDEKNYGEMLDQLIEYRKQRMSHPPKDRAVRIYHKRFEEKNSSLSPITLEQQFQSSKDPVLRQYYHKLAASNSESSTFRNKRKIQFQILVKQPVYESTLVLIKLQNEYILQGVFGPYEKISNVMDFVSTYIQGQVYIYTTPPVVYMNKHREKSLVEMDCVPRGVFQMGADGPWQIRPQFVGFIQA